MPEITTETLKILQPYPGLFAYYDGRIAGRRLHSERKNWLDDGGYALGIASYAFIDGTEALVYDTHLSIAHAAAIRSHLESLGATSIRVVLSHWHTDHIAGNEVFADCEIIALKLTAETMEHNRQKLQAGDPAISPVIMPTRLFEGRLDLSVGQHRLEFHHFNIHSADGNVVWLPDLKLLLAGDTLEDTITYVSEAEHIETHIAELKRMHSMPIEKILPNHGALEKIAHGGYPPSLIDANRRYLERLIDPALSEESNTELKNFIAEDIAAGDVLYFEPYDAVHQQNVAAVKAAELNS